MDGGAIVVFGDMMIVILLHPAFTPPSLHYNMYMKARRIGPHHIDVIVVSVPLILYILFLALYTVCL